MPGHPREFQRQGPDGGYVLAFGEPADPSRAALAAACLSQPAVDRPQMSDFGRELFEGFIAGQRIVQRLLQAQGAHAPESVRRAIGMSPDSRSEISGERSAR